MKHIFAFLFCAAALTWGGCSKDDNGGGSGLLIGKWLLVSEYDEWINGHDEVEGAYDPYEFEESCYIEFRSNGSGAIWSTLDESDREEFTYRFDSSSRRLHWLSEGLSEEAPYIETLTSSELVMAWYFQVSEYRLSEKMIFQRVD